MYRRFLVIAAAVSFALALSSSGCSGQGEGERCDTNDDNLGNDDCASGLACTPSSKLGESAQQYCTGNPTCGMCCPTDLTQATTSICTISPSVPNGNPGIPDGGADSNVTNVTSEAGPDGSSDAPTDSPSDSPSDVAQDAPLDSPAD